MAAGRRPDVVIVSLGSTEGLRTADEQLAGALERAGARTAIARAADPGPSRTMMLTDLRWAMAARAAAAAAPAGAALLYSTTTASLLWPRPGAIRFDAPAAGNRPGRHGLWQRPLERRRLERAPLLLPLSDGGLREAGLSAAAAARALTVPIPVESSGPTDRPRDIAAITHGGNPRKKGLDMVLAAWRRLRATPGRPHGEELVVAGVREEQLTALGLIEPGEPGVRVLGTVPPGDFRALLRRSRVYACAPRREDYGAAQLEALADGCMLVTSESPGPYAALPIARALDPRLVGPDLEPALRAALDRPLEGYAERARAELSQYAPATVERLISERVLPRLLAP